MDPETPLGVKVAGLCFVVAKLIGILAMALMFVGHRTTAGALLALDGLLLAATVTLCVRDGQRQVRAADDDQARIERMLADGTLALHLEEAGYRIRRST